MTNLHELFDEATTAAPPSRLSVQDVYAAIRSRRQRRHLQNLVVAIAVVALAAAGGIAFTANFAGRPPVGAAPPGPIVWAGRGDSAHLYLVKDTCGPAPSPAASPDALFSSAGPRVVCKELLASSDGGATWVSRGAVKYPPTVLGPLALMQFVGGAVATSSDPLLAFELSTDGGATWNPMPGEGTPADAVPPGGKVLVDFGRRLMVFDPAQGRVRQLAHQPTLRRAVSTSVIVTANHIWVSGLNPATLKPAVAVSHDGGATWTERDMPGTAAIPQPTLSNGALDPNASSGDSLQLIAGDGTTAYACIWDGSPEPTPMPQIPGTEGLGWLRTYRTTDGGLTWQAVADGSTTPSYASGWAAAGGRVVVALFGLGATTGTFAASTDGVTYAPAAPPGLPTPLTSVDGSIAFTDKALYLSDDGWTWREVWRD